MLDLLLGALLAGPGEAVWWLAEEEIDHPALYAALGGKHTASQAAACLVWTAMWGNLFHALRTEGPERVGSAFASLGFEEIASAVHEQRETVTALPSNPTRDRHHDAVFLALAPIRAVLDRTPYSAITWRMRWAAATRA